MIPNLRNKLSVSDAEIAELKRSNNEFLRANKKYNERRDAENAKLKARIEELESENIEVRDRLTKVEQKQSQNDITLTITHLSSIWVRSIMKNHHRIKRRMIS